MPWNPLNKYCWDFWFAYQAETLHVFYLQASTLVCAYNPDRRHNQASIGHAVMTAWGWQELHPDRPVLSHREEDAWDSLAIWTGSIIAHQELYYLAYSARRRGDRLIHNAHERRLPQNIGIAVSADLHHWERTPASLQAPVIPNPGIGKFDGINWRDPYVIRDATDGLFYAFICARPQQTQPDAGGCIAYAVTSDLTNWQHHPYSILYTSDRFYLLEVPQVFWRQMQDGQWRFYLLFAPHWSPFFVHEMQIGVTYYVRSQPIVDRQPICYDEMPWEDEPEQLLSDGLFAGKLVNPEAPHPTFLGFQKEDEGGHFVGGLSDPQWAIFDDEGRIHLSTTHPSNL